MKTVDTLPDLGVMRTSDGCYSGHCEAVFRKASRVAGAIRHVFRCRRRELMWVAFQLYLLPILIYSSPIWNPTLQRDINLLEFVQRRFTKQIIGIKELPYSDRLKSLGVLSIRNLRTYADMVTIYKSLRNGSAADFGLSLVSTNTRGAGVRLKQLCATSRVISSLFSSRVSAVWNKPPVNIVSCNSLPDFKRVLKTHLFLSSI